jgi:hypothetical protein
MKMVSYSARKRSPNLSEGYAPIQLPLHVKEWLDRIKRPKEAYYEVIIRLLIEHENLDK